jgi:hypothetical protein
LLGVLAHVRGRRRGKRVLIFVSSLCFCVALGTGEWAFPLLGYVLAYELFAERGPLRERVLALLPSALPGLIFLATRALFGYGALRSGVYIDPVTEPTTFFFAACQRIPVFFADLFFSVPANWWGLGTPWRDRLLAWQVFSPEIWLRLPSWRFWHVVIGVVAMLATFFTLRAGLRDRAPEERREIRWMLIGALISLVPMVASFPTSRLVLPASVAACAAAALVISSSVERFRRHWPATRSRALASLSIAALVCYFQVWEAGRTSYVETRVANYAYGSVREWLLDAEIDDARISKQRMILVNSVEHTSTIFGPFVRWFYGHPMPRSAWVLSGTPHAHDLYRPAPNVLEMQVLGGTMLTSDLETLYRDDRFPFRPGETIRLDGMTVQILRMLWGKPQSVRFVFDKNIDDPSYLFLYSTAEGLVRARLPEVGVRVRYRKAAFPNGDLATTLREERPGNVRCVGPRPPIDECRLGHFSADCGAVAEPALADTPVFACHGLGDCRWFAHACVAEDYVPSACAPSDLCCSAGTPFPKDSWLRRAPYVDLIRGYLQTWGAVPTDNEHDMQVDVALEPKLEPGEARVSCAGPDSERGPCGAVRVDVPPPQQSSLRFSFLPAQGAPGWWLGVEVVDTRAGELHARVCKVELPESPIGRAPQSREASWCVPAVPVQCATRGSLKLNRFPLDLSHVGHFAAHLSADFADGLHVDADL